MRCREARERLSRLTDISKVREEDTALYEHLRECAKCRLLIQAGQLLTSDLEQVSRMRPVRAMTIEQVRNEISIRDNSFNGMSLGVRIMRQINESFHSRPRLSIVSTALIILLIASVFVPVKTEYPAGYVVAFAAPVDSLILNSVNGEKMLAVLDINDASIAVTETESGIVYKIAPLRDSIQVRKLISVIDSLGGQSVRSSTVGAEAKSRTIWQLLLENESPEVQSSSDEATSKRSVTLNLGKIDGKLGEDFTLWMPVGQQYGDSLTGLLLHKQGDKTNIEFLGTGSMAESSNDCGWNSMLNGNTEMVVNEPDGSQSKFDLTNIDDVRKLEEMGYNFFTMEFDTPGQIPIPGMGPELSEVKSAAPGRQVLVEYMVPRAYAVTLKIVDENGKVIRTLLDCISLAGIYDAVWDGLDDAGNRVGPGSYMCRFDAGEYSQTQPVEIDR